MWHRLPARVKQPSLLWWCATLLITGCQSIPDQFVWPVDDHVYQTAAVAADHPVASQAGLRMLRQGGNAVDAAVATSFCLSVVRPYSCGIGGGGFMVIHDPNGPRGEPTQITINYRETSPASVGPTHYVKLANPTASRYGVHAAGVPGTVAGLLHALKTYGTLDRATVLAPAIQAAEQGVPADRSFVNAWNSTRGSIRSQGDSAARLSDNLSAFATGYDRLQVGDIITNPAQARALKLIAEHGADVFYHGEIAQAIAEVMQSNDGPMTTGDLAAYRLTEREPLRAKFQNTSILAMPPPSSGGVAMSQLFAMLDMRYSDVRMLGHNGASYVHFMSELMKHVFADRAEWLADDAFVDVPIGQLTNPDYLERLAWSVDNGMTQPIEHYGSRQPPPDDSGTSHLSVIDASGMAVACTETINGTFGSRVVVPGFGFCLNNEMDDFTTIPGEANLYGLTQSDRNLPQPGKRPLSSMSPTIVLDEHGNVLAIAGASGGPRIISGTFQCLLNAIQYDMNAGESIAAPRFHHQWMPNKLSLEDNWKDKQLVESLQAHGHEVDRRASVGVVQLIVVRPDGIHAASDPRKGGQPAGY